MKSTANKPLVIAFIGGGTMTGVLLNGNGWLGQRVWMRPPVLLTLSPGVVPGWVIFKKKGL